MLGLRSQAWGIYSGLRGWSPISNYAARKISLLPVPPDRLVGLVSCRRDVRHFLATGAQSARAIENTLLRIGRPLDQFSSVLDFGSGAGRVIRHLVGTTPADRTVTWCACDPEAEAVDWLGQHFPMVTAVRSSHAPPLPFDSNSFDLVYAVSIFTHLTLRDQAVWFDELHRVLRPGGVLLLTTKGERFRHQLPAKQQRAFDRGEIVIRNPRHSGSNVCDVFHPPSWAHSHPPRGFALEDFCAGADNGYGGQDHVTFLRSPALVAIAPHAAVERDHPLPAVSDGQCAEWQSSFARNNEFLVVDNFVPPASLPVNLDALKPVIRRTDIPSVSKGGLIAYPSLQELAPQLVALYRSREITSLLSRIVGKPLQPRQEGDEHACAVYWYSQPGDGMAYHFDDCGEAAGVNYTVLLGLRNNSQQKLRCELFRQRPDQGPDRSLELGLEQGAATNRQDVSIDAGTLVVFCGSKLYHGVSALPAGQERVVLSMRYVVGTEPTPSLGKRVRNAFAARGISSHEFASESAVGSIVSIDRAQVSVGVVWRRWRVPYVFARWRDSTWSVPARRNAGDAAIP